MKIAVLLFHDVHELDAVGPYGVLATANRLARAPESATAPAPADGTGGSEVERSGDPLEVYTVAKSRNSVVSSGGLVMTPHWAFASAPPADVLIVPGGAGVDSAIRDRAIASYVQGAASGARLTASVCTGAFLLGSLGMLRDLRATTWAGKRERLLDYEVGEIVDERVAKNERVWCAGGVTAGIDLALELVRELEGDELARRTALHVNYPFWSP